MATIDKKNRVLALGFFDSVHTGHRYLLNKGKKIADIYGLELTILTFNDDFLPNLNRDDKEVFLLKERLNILKNLNFNDVIVINPTKDFLSQSETEFMDYLLSFNPVAIVAGSDYTFGKNGRGNISLLKEYMKKKNIRVFEIDLKKHLNVKISTTDIKRYLSEGNINKVNSLLGQKYFITGKVTKGRGVGTQYGIPTANIKVHKLKHIPKAGIYKTSTEVDGKIYKSITNVGMHPTFNDINFNIETMLLDFSDNLYNKEIIVYFDNRVRDIKKFKNPDELVEQIKKDIVISYGKIL